MQPSMRSVGDCLDNAMCGSFFATLECQLLDRRRLHTQAEARVAVFEFIERWYSPQSPPLRHRLSVADKLRKEPLLRTVNRKLAAVHSTGVTPV